VYLQRQKDCSARRSLFPIECLLSILRWRHESRSMLGRVMHAPSFPRARTVGALLGLDMFAADGCSSLNVAQMHGRLSLARTGCLCRDSRTAPGSLLY
jgi:hypothetical protein